MTLTFTTLSSNFAKVKDLNVQEVGNLIGGHVKLNIDNKTFENACAIRLSYAFNYSGITVPKSGYGETSSGADKKWYIYRVADIIKFVKAKIGGTPMKGKTAADFKGHKGVIIFTDCGWSDATGHVDLYDGTNVLGHDYSSRNPGKIELYQLS